MKNKKINVLMTRDPGFDAKILSWYMNFPYTHTSIGLEEDMDTYYSFISKGFIVESIRRYEKPDRPSFPCALYEIDVTEETYEKVKKMLYDYKAQKPMLKFSTLGLVMCFLRIPLKCRNRYFCSQFVAEVLQKCQVIELKKRSTLCFAKDIAKNEALKPVFYGTHIEYVKKYVESNIE